MSTTVTEEQLNGILNDYTIHITGDASLTKSTHHQGLPATQNPPQWPTDRRRIPKFRPIDRTRTREERPNGSNAIEMAFLTVMFTGVVLNATAAKIWGATGGRWFPSLLRYAIGGEW